MRKIKVVLACVAVAGLTVLNFTQSETCFATSSASSSGTSTSASSSSSPEPKKYGYNPTVVPCPFPSAKSKVTCGKMILGGAETECMNSDC